MGAHFGGGKVVVLLFLDGVVPAAELVEDLTTEAVLELVQSVHRVGRVAVRGDAEHIIFTAIVLFCDLDCPPLQGIRILELDAP